MLEATKVSKVLHYGINFATKSFVVALIMLKETVPTQFQFDILLFQSFWVNGSSGLIVSLKIEFGLKYTKPTTKSSTSLKSSSIVDDILVALSVCDPDSLNDVWDAYYKTGYIQKFDEYAGVIYTFLSPRDSPTLNSIEEGNRT